MKLPLSFAAIGTDDFKDTFVDEFTDAIDPSDLESNAEYGGCAEDLEVSVMDVDDLGDDTVDVDVLVGWSETRQSGCSDITYSHPHTTRYDVSINRTTGKVVVTETDHRCSWGD